MKTILFNTEMTKAILGGCKVQTRRLALFKEQDEIVELRKHDKTHVYNKDVK